MTTQPPVPRALRTWFVVHFVVDWLFAIPLLVAPVFTLTLFGWSVVDPVSARLVGAALIGIGGESWLARDASRDAYRTMLRLKVLWSGAANLGLAWSLAEGAPPMTWAFLAIFLSFSANWIYWKRRLDREAAATARARVVSA